MTTNGTGAVPDACGVAEAIRDGSTSAVETVRASLARLAETVELNAFTTVVAETALRQAGEVDAGTRTGPLAGVPISVKDHVWLAGLPATNGSRALRDFIAPQSAVCVQRLVDAGAIVVGKTNNPEFCYRGVTENELFGITRNPQDPTRTTGGSSGGAAASVASGVVPLAVGTDGGGSIRIPSAFCGTFGLKPTFGLIPKTPGFRGWPTLSVTGPIAASARDLALATSVMAGAAPEDPYSYPGVVIDAADAGYELSVRELRELRVAVSDDLGVSDLDPDVRAAFHAAVRALTDAGVDVVQAHPEPVDPSPLWDSIALPEGYASEGPLVEADPDLIGVDAREITLAGRGIGAQAYLDAQHERAEMVRSWQSFFTGVDVLLTPTMPVTAFETGRLAPATVDGIAVPPSFDAWCSLSLPANLVGLPAATVPIRGGRDGLPVGLQIMSARWRDALVLRVAGAVAAITQAAVTG